MATSGAPAMLSSIEAIFYILDQADDRTCCEPDLAIAARHQAIQRCPHLRIKASGPLDTAKGAGSTTGNEGDTASPR